MVDGTGRPARRADVLVRDGKIVFVGAVSANVVAARVVDAAGLVVTPGFVDAHSHSDPLGTSEHLLAQGVTTIVVGQDGVSAEHIGPWLDGLDAKRPRVNVATMVGHATVRVGAGVGARPKPSERLLAEMTRLVDDGMKAGAFGLSTALEYDAGAPAGPDELARLAKPVGARGGIVMSHLRSEDDDAIEASLAELFEQCRGSGAGAHVAHLKIVLGKGAERARRILALLDAERRRGTRVTADLYPYTASFTTIGILFPSFAKPPNDYRDATTRRHRELVDDLRARVVKRNGPAAMTFGSGDHVGQTLEAAARKEGKPFEELLADLGPNGASASYRVMDETVVSTLFQDPFVMIGSDGGGGSPHPRGNGTFAKVLRELVRARGLVPLEEAVRKMSRLPAEALGFADERGTIAKGLAADLAVFDPAEVKDNADYEHPHRMASGMRFVVVNGEVELEAGKLTGARAGRALRFHGRGASVAGLERAP